MPRPAFFCQKGEEMKTLQQFLGLIALLLISRVVAAVIGLPVPPTILAMLLLWALLEAKVIRVHWFEEIRELLLKHILLFLIPVSLSFTGVLDQLQGYWIKLILIVLIGSTVTFTVTAYTINRLLPKEKKDAERTVVR